QAGNERMKLGHSLQQLRTLVSELGQYPSAENNTLRTENKWCTPWLVDEIGSGGAAMWSRLPVPQNPAIRSD
ncbi:MAG: hypothetical protein ACJ8E1_10665, partial [Xanthobacteraceae bacterium]